MFWAEDELNEDRRHRSRQVFSLASFDFALSALVLREIHQTWAVGPGFHISRLWRSQTKSKAPSRAADSKEGIPARLDLYKIHRRAGRFSFN